MTRCYERWRAGRAKRPSVHGPDTHGPGSEPGSATVRSDHGGSDPGLAGRPNTAKVARPLVRLRPGSTSGQPSPARPGLMRLMRLMLHPAVRCEVTRPDQASPGPGGLGTWRSSDQPFADPSRSVWWRQDVVKISRASDGFGSRFLVDVGMGGARCRLQDLSSPPLWCVWLDFPPRPGSRVAR